MEVAVGVGYGGLALALGRDVGQRFTDQGHDVADEGQGLDFEGEGPGGLKGAGRALHLYGGGSVHGRRRGGDPKHARGGGPGQGGRGERVGDPVRERGGLERERHRLGDGAGARDGDGDLDLAPERHGDRADAQRQADTWSRAAAPACGERREQRAGDEDGRESLEGHAASLLAWERPTLGGAAVSCRWSHCGALDGRGVMNASLPPPIRRGRSGDKLLVNLG